MTKIIGDPNTFAVQYLLHEIYDGPWLWGKFCYWIKGVQFGDYEDNLSLRDLILELRSFTRDNGNREHPELFSLPADQLFERLDSVLFSGDLVGYELIGIEECWARFRISPIATIFSGWKIFLVERPPLARIIIAHEDYDSGERSIREEYLTSGVFDKVISDVFNTLIDLHDAEVEKEKNRPEIA